MVTVILAHHPAISHYLRFLATTLGRDKLLRTIQYFSRFYAAYLAQYAATNAASDQTLSQIKIFTAIKAQFGLIRKAMRIGKFLEHFQLAARGYESTSQDPILRFLTIARQLGYGFYLTFDTLTFPDTAKIYNYQSAARFQILAYKAWLIGILSNILAGLYTLIKLRYRQSLLHSGAPQYLKEAQQIETDKSNASWQLLSDFCDATIPGSALGYVKANEEAVGLAGTVSSVLALKTQWSKTA